MSVLLNLGVVLLILAVLTRFGLLCLIVVNVFGQILGSLPISLDVSSWYSLGSWLVLFVVVAVVLYAAKLALGGRALFPEALPAD